MLALVAGEVVADRDDLVADESLERPDETGVAELCLKPVSARYPPTQQIFPHLTVELLDGAPVRLEAVLPLCRPVITVVNVPFPVLDALVALPPDDDDGSRVVIVRGESEVEVSVVAFELGERTRVVDELERLEEVGGAVTESEREESSVDEAELRLDKVTEEEVRVALPAVEDVALPLELGTGEDRLESVMVDELRVALATVEDDAFRLELDGVEDPPVCDAENGQWRLSCSMSPSPKSDS